MTSQRATLSASQYHKHWVSLLSATLESWIHQLLYTRHVYPRETFSDCSFLGVRCHTSRHSGVASYVTNTLKVAIPSIVSGVATELALSIFNDGSNAEEEVERYVLRFSDMVSRKLSSDESPAPVPLAMLHDVERGMRNLLLSALAVQSDYNVKTSDTTTFRLILHIPSRDKSCPALNESFATGKWFILKGNDISVPSDDADHHAVQVAQVLRPRHNFSNSTVGRIQFATVEMNRNGTRPYDVTR